MSYRRFLPSILRPSSRRSASKCPMLSTPPSLSSRRSEYATSVRPPPAIDDDFPGKGSIGKVCRLGDGVVRACSEDGGSSVERTEALFYGDEWENELDVLEDECVVQDLIPDLKQVYVKARRYFLEKKLQQKKLLKRGQDKIFGSSTLRNGSIGTVCWLDGYKMVDVRFPNKIWLDTTHLEVLPATLEVYPDTPLVLKVWDVVYPCGDMSVVRATTPKKGTEGLAVGEKVFGFPMYKPLEDHTDEIPELDELKREVWGLRDELRITFEEEDERGRMLAELSMRYKHLPKPFV